MAAGLLEVPEGELSLGIRFFFKPANGGGPVPWHQDEAHKDPDYDHRSVNAWVPFDAVGEANGCLNYIPGSHRGEIYGLIGIPATAHQKLRSSAMTFGPARLWPRRCRWARQCSTTVEPSTGRRPT